MNKVEGTATPAEDVEVTLSHPVFGSYTFRAPEDKIAGYVTEALHAAKHRAAVKAKVAELDAKQVALQAEATKATGREADRLRAQADDIVAQRQRLVEQQ